MTLTRTPAINCESLRAPSTSALGATVTLNPNGSFTYDPSTSSELQSIRLGENRIDTFVYTTSDGTSTSTGATVTVTVTGRTDPPTALNDSYTTDEDRRLSVLPSQGVLKNDTDLEGATLTALLFNGATRGNVTLAPDGSFTYQPNSDFAGTDTFTYRVRNGSLNSAVATVTLTVAALNDRPVAVNDLYTGNRNVALHIDPRGILINDTDPDAGDVLTSILVANAANGSVSLASDGSFIYTPVAGFTGSDAFTYRARDSAGELSNVATVSIQIQNDKSWQNARNRLDVNDDTHVSAIDVLIVVNSLNNDGPRQLPEPPPPGFPPPYFDVNGDGFISPSDALDIINFLNSQGGEGESYVGAVTAADSDSLEGLQPETPISVGASWLPELNGATLNDEIAATQLSSPQGNREGLFSELGVGRSDTVTSRESKRRFESNGFDMDPLDDLLEALAGDQSNDDESSEDAAIRSLFS